VIHTAGVKTDRPYAMIDLSARPIQSLHIVERYRLREYSDVKDAIERNKICSGPCGVEPMPTSRPSGRASENGRHRAGLREHRHTPRRKARAAETDGNMVTARDNWYMAAIHYGAAEWPYDDSGEKHLALHRKKRDCYALRAPGRHKIEAVSIPFKGKTIPGWFHLPPGTRDGKLP